MIKISTNISGLGDSNNFNVPIYNEEIQSSFTDDGFSAERWSRHKTKISPDYPEDISISIDDPESVSLIMASLLLSDKSIPAIRPAKFLVTIDGESFGVMTELRMVNLDGFDKSITLSAFDNSADAILDIIIGYRQ